MPLLRRQPFHKQKPPPDLRSDEEVFHCKLTNEVFRDYEEFFERIILCNSLVWSCGITGKSGLTYQEALDSEEKAKKNLSAFPNYLQRPILYLTTLTCRTRLIDLSEDIFTYAKDRYFAGEIVDVLVGTQRKSCKIQKVLCTIQPRQQNGDVICIDSDSEEEESPSTTKYGHDPDSFEYVVQEIKKPTIMTVKSDVISRKRTLYTREKSKLFLKHHTDSSSGIFKVKDKVARQLGLHNFKFEDFFAGPPPQFEKSEVKKKVSPKRVNGTPGSSKNSPMDTGSGKKRGRKKLSEKKSPKQLLSPEQKLQEQFHNLSPAQRAALRETIKQEKMAEKMAKKEEMKKKLEEERVKRKEEKAKEKEKMRIERMQEVLLLREKNRPRDDMECDDLKVMPNFKPVQTRVPVDLFGDAIMILEFIQSFKSLFDFKQFFPKGFTWGMLESCLLDHDVDGPLCDLVQMMLVAIFTLQEEEAEEVEELDKQDREMTTRNEDELDDEDKNANHMIMMATLVSQMPQLNHGMPLKEMLLDQFTLTEILRIHLASSGARASMKNARFRYQQRGGYTSLDDAGIELRMHDPTLMKNLAAQSLFDLSPGEKLKVINTLLQQIMSYAATRDVIEENYEKLRLMKYDLKQLQWAEQRREREDAQARYRQRQEEKQRERERKLQKMLEREEKLKAEEAAGNGAVNGDGKGPKNKLLVLDDDRDTPSPDLDEDNITEEEKQKRRRKEEEEEGKKKAEFIQKEQDLTNQILELQRTNAVYPIGRDRMYRRYWVFNAIPGLFVEDNEVNVDPDVLDPFSSYLEKHNSIPELTAVDEKNTSSDKENESLNMSVTENGSVQPAQDPRVKSLKKDEDVIVISDSDTESRDASTKDEEMEVDEPPPALDSLAAQQISNRKKVMWSFVDNKEVLNELLESLNPRGFREAALRQSMDEIRGIITDALEECPIDDLSLPSDAVEEARVKALALTRGISGKKAARGAVQNDTAQEAIELNLRDTMLDLEDRIYAGSLGYMKIDNRQKWREAIESGSYDPQTKDPTFVRQEKMDESSDDMSTSFSQDRVVKDLSRAMLQIARGLEHKYLGQPLGESEEAKKKRIKAEKDAEEKRKKKHEKGDDDEDDREETSKHKKTTWERWEESLMSSSSLSQVFLHLSTLDKSITWSKSALHARCRLCRRKGDAEKMLLCDGCDRGHHMDCLKPPVKKIPSGDWYCPNCKPKEVQRSPRKDRRKTFSEEEEDPEEVDEEEEEDDDNEEEEEEEDSDAESEEEDEEEEEDEDVNENRCVKCNKEGMLLCCDSCPSSYHLQCADPPLKKVPRGKWLCQVCLGVDKPGGKIKIVHKKKDKSDKSSNKKGTPKGTPNTSRPSSRRGSPRDSPVPSKPSRRSLPASEERPKMTKKTSTSRLSQDVYADMDGSPKHYVSSYRGNSNVQQMKQLEDIVNDINKMDDAWPFLKPVSKKDVPDYYEVIDKPMDFSTIRNKINKFAYKKTTDLITDVRQIFINCIEYNNRKTAEYKCGATLSKLFESKVKEFEKETDESSPPPTKKSKR